MHNWHEGDKPPPKEKMITVYELQVMKASSDALVIEIQRLQEEIELCPATNYHTRAPS